MDWYSGRGSRRTLKNRPQACRIGGLALSAALVLLAGCSTLDPAPPVTGVAIKPQVEAPAPVVDEPARTAPDESTAAKAVRPRPLQPETPVAVAPEPPPQGAEGRAQVQRLALLPTEVLETSGLALIDGRLWTLNDSGDDAVLYQLSGDGRRISKQLYLAGARNIDWESLAQDEEYLYIGDCGNNRGRRGTLTLYLVPLAELSAPDGSRVTYETGHFRYGQRLEVTASDNHNFDCEAITVVGDELWLFSKNRGDGNTELYRLDKRAADQAVFPSASYPVEGLVTAADYDPVSNRLVLLGYSRQRFFGHSFIWFIPLSSDAGNSLKLAPKWSGARRYRLSDYAQWEAISWDGPDRLILSAERSPLSDVQLGEIRLDGQGEPRVPEADPDDAAYW